MNANETKFQPIIEGVKQYVVPLFQRAYSWGKNEWEILWSDLLELSDTDNPRSHFIGSIVSMPTNSVPEGVAKYLLIDGQQRLTTIFILLVAIRDKANSNENKDLADEINDTLLVNRYKKETDFYKILPTQVDRIPFQHLIDKTIHADDEDSQIIRAYRFFIRKLQQVSIDLRKLQLSISNHLSVVSIVLDPDDNPHLVFESLNAKGRPLTQSDLIRNFFFMRIHSNQQEDIYNKYWKPMEDSLGEQLTEFIRHYLMKNGTAVKKNDIYFSLKDLVNQQEAMPYLEDLKTFAEYYEKLLFPMKETNKTLQKALLRIQRLEATTVYPFLLNCYHDYTLECITVNQFKEVISVIENFLIRRFICSVPTNQLNKVFPTLYNQVKNYDNSEFIVNLKHVLQTKRYPKDNEFKIHLIESQLYGGGDRGRKTKLILETIEESYNHKETVPFEKLTIEHIMPQTLTPYWQEHLGDNWEEVQELYLHTLGNLTITAYNSELANDDFAKKKERLVNSHLELNKYFLNKSQWGMHDIELRSKELAERCLTIWEYFGEDQESPDTNVTGTTPRQLTILGQKFVVKSWRDVMEYTLNTIAELEPEKFELIIQNFPKFVGKDQSKFRAIRRLQNEFYIEVNLSAKAIQHFCIQILSSIGLTTDEWIVDTI